MFIGHFALGFAAKKAAPPVSLAVLFVACQLADVLWPVLVLLGIERVAIEPGVTAMTPLNFISYPYSHSLVTLCLWGIALGAIYVVIARAHAATALLLTLLVVSHWVLDVVAHRPDMPIAPGASPKLGLGLWNSIPATVAVEVTMFAAGVWLYRGAAASRSRGQRIGLWALVGLLLILYVANIVGPPPPSVTALAWTAVAGSLLFLVWAWAVDRSRSGNGNERSAR
jgi:hypothetical protein